MPKRTYLHAGPALLRAATAPRAAAPAWWPDPTDSAQCQAWLTEVWSRPANSERIRYASPTLAQQVDGIITGQVVEKKRISRATMAAARYLLRATGRPTPFGLFAGVATATVGPRPILHWGEGHRAVARADTVWLASIIERLEDTQTLLLRLDVVVNNLTARRGARLHVPHGGPNGATVRYTSVVRLVEEHAASPIRVEDLLGKLMAAFPQASRARAARMVTDLVRQGFLITCLRAAMTVPDPLAHLLDRLEQPGVARDASVVSLLEELRAVHDAIGSHNTAALPEQAALRETLDRRMRGISGAGRSPLAVDVLLDVGLQLPATVVREMEYAAHALLRLTRRPAGHGVWQDYAVAFWERYGTNTLVPVADLIDPGAGLGFPAEYPGSIMPKSATRTSDRDRRLLALAWNAAVARQPEIVLTDDLIDDVAETRVGQHEPPHIEMCARIHAADLDGLERGDFTLTVTPARSAGTLTSRFTAVAGAAALEDVYRRVPTAIEGAVAAQLSFPPMYPHTENVCRIPTFLNHIVSLGEHRPASESHAVIPLDDLAVTWLHNQLHLVSISRGAIVEPQVFHAMALEKQPPPLARFLAHLPRAFSSAWTGFDWGPDADALPYLPRLRYGRTVLCPARWRLTSTDLTAAGGGLQQWQRRWQCPNLVELRDDDRTLRLDLEQALHVGILQSHLDRHGMAVLTETELDDADGWIGGHAHEVAIPLTSVSPLRSAPLPLTQPTVRNHSLGAMPGSPGADWFSSRIYTHPERIDEILADRLPQLLGDIGEPDWWFVRYRSPHESDHIRLRLRLDAPDQYGAVAARVACWVEDLRREHLASRLVLDTYSPEYGRYGVGPAMAAAEAVFVADSRAVASALRHAGGPLLHRSALTALGMVDIAQGFLQSDAAAWFAEHRPTEEPQVERAVTEQVIRVARQRTPFDLPGTSHIADAWSARASALIEYTRLLPAREGPDMVLESLLHMHHNRSAGIDRADEAACRRLARQAARTRLAIGGERR